ncbi:MAG: tyrosine-type recombinase/integrase [Acetobacteraceae bacterium]|nr:tyrosine-type recombinase/integrase [Acetobacteraceae bacterium]
MDPGRAENWPGGDAPELRLATVLAVTTDRRESDVLRFPWSGLYRWSHPRARRESGRARLDAGAPDAQSIVGRGPAEKPDHRHRARGKPYTQNGFQRRFFEVIRKLRNAGRVGGGLTFHGLRTTTATMLAEAGCDTRTIMAITGHKAEAMVRLYIEETEKKKRSGQRRRLPNSISRGSSPHAVHTANKKCMPLPDGLSTLLDNLF